MTTIMPEGENLRKAVKWIMDEQSCDTKKNLAKLVQESCIKYDLSPKEADFLNRVWLKQNA